MTNKRLEKFKLAALENISKVIGRQFSGSEITELFRKSGYETIKHDGGTKWRFLYQTFDDLQRRYDGQYMIIKFLETACDPQEHIANPEHQKLLIESLNNTLAFYALRINEKGQAIVIDEQKHTATPKETEDYREFVSQNYHFEIVMHGKEPFVRQDYFKAVNECCKAFENYVSKKSGLQESGSRLMGKALSGNGKLRLNSYITETEKNQQDGLRTLCLGLVQKIRNPMSHETQHTLHMDKQDALDILGLISYLYKEIDKCQTVGSI